MAQPSLASSSACDTPETLRPFPHKVNEDHRRAQNQTSTCNSSNGNYPHGHALGRIGGHGRIGIRITVELEKPAIRQEGPYIINDMAKSSQVKSIKSIAMTNHCSGRNAMKECKYQNIP